MNITISNTTVSVNPTIPAIPGISDQQQKEEENYDMRFSKVWENLSSKNPTLRFTFVVIYLLVATGWCIKVFR